jgi:hypothetical protein
MKYEKRKKNKTVDAVQLNSLADVDKVFKDCPHVEELVDAYWHPSDPGGSYVVFNFSEKYNELSIDNGRYLVWDDKNVWVMSANKFEKKYERSYSIATSTNGLIYTGTNSNGMNVLKADGVYGVP